MHMKQFLDAVAADGKDLQPRSDSVDDLAAFQSVVEVAFKAEARGYVKPVITRRESFTGHHFYSVLVVPGLTEEGHEVRRA